MFDGPATGGTAKNGAVDRVTFADLTGRLRAERRQHQKTWSDELWEIANARSNDARAQFEWSVIEGVFSDSHYDEFIAAANRTGKHLVVEEPHHRLRFAADFETATFPFLQFHMMHNRPSLSILQRDVFRPIRTACHKLYPKLRNLDPAAKTVIELAAEQINRDAPSPVDSSAIKLLIDSIARAEELLKGAVSPVTARIALMRGLSARTGLPLTATYDDYKVDPEEQIRGPLVDLGVKMLAAISVLELPKYNLPDAAVAVGRSAVRKAINGKV